VSCICKDCGMDTTPRKRPGEYYMIHDALWFAAGMTHHPDGEDAQFKEYLCIGCLEKRLGRELTGVDFTVAPVNNVSEYVTPRMLDRLNRVTPEQRLERASLAVEMAVDVRDDAIHDLIDAELAYRQERRDRAAEDPDRDALIWTAASRKQ
jgi:hypothetical protein